VLDFDRTISTFEMCVPRGIGHELMDGQGETPAALRLEWQPVGA
jgi:hypothetical protein